MTTMTINRWNPSDVRHDLLDAFRPAGVFYPLSGRIANQPASRAWAPVTDVVESEHEYLITAELPGMSREDISVTLENGVITIQGEHKPLPQDNAGKLTWHLQERHCGKFERSFSLPEEADLTSLQAEFRNGLLNLRLAKKAEAKPRLIEVK